MKFLPQLLSLLTAAAAVELSGVLPETFIQNHNVNIILNVDAKEIANELWKVIESHLNNTEDKTKTRRLLERSAVNELEQLVRRYVQPSRRFNHLAEFELAQNFEKIVQKVVPAVVGSRSLQSTVNTGKVDDIVDDMMWATRNLMQKKKRVGNKRTPEIKSFNHILQHMMKSLKSIEKGVKEFAELINKTDTADSSIRRSMNHKNHHGRVST